MLLKKTRKKINIGLIGLGYLGKYHYQKLIKNQLCSLKWIVDSNQQQINSINSNIKNTKDFRAIINDIDAVSIVTPTQSHYLIAKFFLERGKHVLIEKPMTETVSQADKLIKIANKNKVVLQVGLLERFNPVMEKLEKELKQPMFIEGHRLAEFNKRSTDIDVIFDLMIHDIDIIMSLIKAKVKKISAFGKKILTSSIDIANVRLEFENGCVVNLTASRISQKNERKIRVFEKNMYLSVDFMNHSINKFVKNTSKSKDLFKNKKFKFKKSDALKSEIDNFLKSCQGNEYPKVSGVDGKNAIVIASMISSKLK
tara:strand:- start:474 stop:1409 length:936 start_codon:yes stop_codon:yes gene_type:complete